VASLLLHGAGLFVAGAVAGIIGTAGGITSLVAYPALLASGLHPLAANVTNSVALLGSGASSTLRARVDLHGHRQTLRRWLPGIALFSLVGAMLLVVTPSSIFDRIVPFLIAIGSIIVLAQPRIARWQNARSRPIGPAAVAGSGVAVATYNGYFGAGAGILMIALLLLTTEPELVRANSLKNVILVVADLLPAVLFAIFSTVVWSAVLPLGLGAVVGGLIGPTVARRIPPRLLRVLIAACGFALAIWLLVSTS
jgi:uncharacterized membrane protein YfcA